MDNRLYILWTNADPVTSENIEVSRWGEKLSDLMQSGAQILTI